MAAFDDEDDEMSAALAASIVDVTDEEAAAFDDEDDEISAALAASIVDATDEDPPPQSLPPAARGSTDDIAFADDIQTAMALSISNLSAAVFGAPEPGVTSDLPPGCVPPGPTGEPPGQPVLDLKSIHLEKVERQRQEAAARQAAAGGGGGRQLSPNPQDPSVATPDELLATPTHDLLNLRQTNLQRGSSGGGGAVAAASEDETLTLALRLQEEEEKERQVPRHRRHRPSRGRGMFQGMDDAAIAAALAAEDYPDDPSSSLHRPDMTMVPWRLDRRPVRDRRMPIAADREQAASTVAVEATRSPCLTCGARPANWAAGHETCCRGCAVGSGCTCWAPEPSHRAAAVPPPETTTRPAAKPRPSVSARVEEPAALECCICMNSLGPAGERMALPCMHVFHRECVAKWLAVSKTCPTCKTPAG